MGIDKTKLAAKDAAGNATGLGLFPIRMKLSTAVSQADVRAGATKPGFPCIVERVETYTRTKAGTVTVDVKKNTTSVLSGAGPIGAGTLAEQTLTATRANRIFAATDVLNFHYTTDGTGALVDGEITVWIRPYPMAGEYAV